MSNNSPFRSGGIASVLIAAVASAGLLSAGVTREVPVGALRGQIVMEHSRAGLPGADVVLERVTEDLYEGNTIFRAETLADGTYKFPSLPAGKYQLSAYGHVHSAHKGVVVSEGRGNSLDLVAKRDPANINLTAGSRVFVPGEQVKLRINGILDDSNVDLTVRKINPDAVEQEKSLADLLYALATDRSRKNPAELARSAPIERTENIVIDTRDIEGSFVKDLSVDGLAEGNYLVSVGKGSIKGYTWLTVTNIALVSKYANGGGIAYVCNIQTGEPVPGASVDIVSQTSRKALGPTGDDGTVPLGDVDRQQSGQVLLSAKTGESRAYTWFYVSTPDGSDSVASHFVTDRPVYRPGDTVQFKEILRARVAAGYEVLPPGPVMIDILNPDGTSVHKVESTIDDWGTVAASFVAPKEGPIGEYEVSFQAGGQTRSEYVEVSEYRKPQFRIAVSPEKPSYTRGDKVRFKVECTSFTDEPVPGAKIDASLSMGSMWGGSPFDDEYDPWWEDEWFYGEYVRSFSLSTDETGVAWVEFDPARLTSEGLDLQVADAKFKLDVAVSDEGGRYFEGSGTVTVVRGEVELDCRFDRWESQRGDAVNLEVVAQAASDESPLQSQVEVVLEREVWGQRAYTEVVESRSTVTTGPDGRATVALNPQKSGSYSARVTTTDRRGNRVSAETYIYVSGDAEPSSEQRGGYRLVVPEPSYAPGVDAELLILASKAGGSALVTVEAERVLFSTVVPIKGKETRVSVPVLAAYAPNVDVNVCVVKDKEFFTARRTLKVGNEQNTIKVELMASTKEAHPGDPVEFTVKTSDPDGTPVQADVAVGVVDEGVYQVREDTTDPVASFYPRRWSEVSTAYSFPQIYLGGDDKSGADSTVRRNFQDTAAWSPSVRTDGSGMAKVSLRLPDNLTSWRATATAVTRDTRAGKGISNVVARKELMARLSLPQFMTVGDRQDVTAWFVNATDQEMVVQVTAQAQGAEISGQAKQTVKIPGRGQVSTTWELTAAQPGKATLTVKAEGGAFSDGLEQSVEIQPRGIWRLSAATGVAGQQKAWSSSLVVDPDATEGELVVTVNPNRFSVLESSLESLVDYPYGCVEQTMSRFVPAVMVRGLMAKAGIERPALYEKIDEVSRQSLAKLKVMRHPDGGWGWWENDETSDQMTALVLDGLFRARSVGLTVPDDLVAGGLQVAKERLKLPKPTYGSASRYELALAVLRFGFHKLAADTLVAGVTDKDAQAETLAVGLSIAAGQSGDAMYKASRDKAFKTAVSQSSESAATVLAFDTRRQARFIEACLLSEPNGTRAEKAMAGLLAQRKGAAWLTTWHTGQAVIAASVYLSLKPEVSFAGQAEIQVNGKPVWKGSLDKSSKPVVTRVPLSGLVAGRNRVALLVAGTGQAWAAADLRQSVAVGDSYKAQAAKNLAVRREYFPMETVRLEDGTLRRVVGKRGSDSFKQGDVFRVRLTLRADASLGYVCIEDPIPSNCRIVESGPDPDFEWSHWWSNANFFDDKATFFVTSVEKGERVIEYAIRAEAQGTCAALPARAYAMYQPEIEATSALAGAKVK